ncbi:RNA polymerase subunit sigma-70 [Amycolatopsis sp. AA4]|uniref:sigma-70 family RNA polymerase sigma factor n=1 Tax=Actinomycetes TaxID=1760 RepID=UPI0001B54626|nr:MULTISPECIES: sigma-70 family RNA polymerase sigma factor [Actinomycetes]ATY14479.1 RNA polymerase subunit sigma-70 [Amycolatopsis sp. AA4]EFL10570.1 RNA polymerase factor sigma-70 [Streptomyces sp. AA4]
MGEFSSESAFTRAVAPLRAELRAHCYRMLGSIHDADDAVQEALLRAWRGLPGFEGRSALRTWLYTVATRTCLDLIEQRGRRALPVDLGPSSEQVAFEAPRTDVAWLGPCPDFPAASYEQREAVELAFVAACRHLPGNQRAALLLFDVLGFSAAEIATIMETSVTSVNSALARARRTISAHVPARTQQQTLRTLGDARLQELVTGFATALADGDVDGLVNLLTEDVTWSMPPLPQWYRGRAAVTEFAVQVPITRCPSWRFRLTSANAQPAVAFYLGGSATAPHEAWSITVLTLREDRICDLTSFLGAEHFPAFGLPATVRP